jgi:hypothetical protein
MKYIKMFEQYLKENQLKLFPDYEKSMPDNPKEIGMQYLKDREVKHSKVDDTIKTWEDVDSFIKNKENQINAKDKSFDDLSYEVDKLDSLDDLDSSELIKRLNEYIIKNNLDNNIINSLDNNINVDSIKSLFKNNNLNWNDFEEYVIETIFDEEVYKLLDEGSSLNKLSEWVDRKQGIIYRAMNLPNKISDLESILYHGVGNCWSFKRSGAISYNGIDGNNTDIVLSAKVEPQDVDWSKTLELAYWGMSDELEVRLKVDTTIDIIGFEVSSNHHKFSDMKDKDEKYFSEVLGLDYDTISNITTNKGSYNIQLEEPITVKT